MPLPSLIPLTLDELESDEELQALYARVQQEGQAALTREEAQRRQRSLDAIGAPPFGEALQVRGGGAGALGAWAELLGANAHNKAGSADHVWGRSSCYLPACMHPFAHRPELASHPPMLQAAGVSPLVRGPAAILQLNIGLYCNQACRHCHVESSPK